MEKIKEYFRIALKLINKYELPPLPEIYTVFFTYASCRNAKLNEEIDLLIKNKDKLSFDKVYEIYKKYFLASDFNFFDNIFGKIKSELIEILKSVKESENFYKNKNNQFKSIKITPENIKLTIEKVISEIESLTTHTTNMHNNFKKSEENLVKIKEEVEKLRKEAIIDPLTEVYNRRGFNEKFNKLKNSEESLKEISLIFVDIDDFKKINDNYGHLIGDEVLRYIARTLKENIKGKDILARFGGEEFIILTYNTPYNDVVNLAENLRKKIEQKRLKIKNTEKKLPKITVSIGVAKMKENEDIEQLIERADKLMYKSKKLGKNKVTSEEL